MNNILILNWRGPDHPQAGGAELYLTELARRWVADSVAVTLVCAHDSNRPFAHETHTEEGYTVRAMGNRFTVYLLAALFLLFRGHQYDRVIDASNGIPFFAPLYTRTPVTLLVHHVHRLQWRLEFPRLVAELGWFLESRLVPFLYRKHPIITISSATTEELQKLGFDQKQIWIVHPGNPYQSAKASFQTNGHRLLYVGRLKDYKRVELLVKAVDHLRHEFQDIRLDIVGRGPKYDGLRSLVSHLGLDDRVSLHGYLDECSKQELYSKATAFVTASMMEGWGLGVVEANSYGVPVVAYRNSGLSESVRHNETGLLVPPGASTGVFADTIGQLLRDKLLQNKLARGGYRWARNFDWDTSAREIRWVLEHGQESLSQQRGQSLLANQGPVASVLGWFNRLPSRLIVFGSFSGTSLINYGFGLLMASLLLPGDFGLLAFAQTVLLLAGLVLNSGYAWSLTAAMPRAKQVDRGRLVRGMLVSNLLLALLLSTTLVALFAIGPLRGGLERWSITLLIASSFPFLSIIAIGRGTMRGVEAFASMGIIQVSEVAIKLFSGLAFVALGFGPEGAVAGFLVGAGLAAFLSLALIAHELDISPLGSIARVSPIGASSMFAAVLGMALLLNLDILAVKLFAGGDRALTGHYQAAIMLANIPYFMTTALLAVLFPQLAAVGTLDRTGPRLTETLRIILLLLIPVEMALAFAPEVFLSLFFPESYIVGAPLLRILAFGNMALILAATFSTAFQATGQARIPAAVLLLVVTAEFVGLRLLVPLWQARAAAGLFSAGGTLALLALAGIYLNKIESFELGSALSWLGRYLLALGIAAVVFFASLTWTGQPLVALLTSLLLYGFMLAASGLWSFTIQLNTVTNRKQEGLDAYTPPGL